MYWVRADGSGEAHSLTDVKFRLRTFGSATSSTYDLAPDGKRLAAILADDANGEKPMTRLTCLLNFFDELRRKVPPGK